MLSLPKTAVAVKLLEEIDRRSQALKLLILPISLVAAIAFTFSPAPSLAADACEQAVRELNSSLRPKINEKELVEILRSLNRHEQLPEKFVTKRDAKRAGWRPGQDLWTVPGLRGKSIGGDLFRNLEGKLPDGGRKWHEADLDYRGGHRGSKRLIYSDNGDRVVTVDHYRTFHEVPLCR